MAWNVPIGRPFKEQRIKVPHMSFKAFLKMNIEAAKKDGAEIYPVVIENNVARKPKDGEKCNAVRFVFPNEAWIKTLDSFREEWEHFQSKIYF